MTKSCGGCRFALYEDHGYSNWTVEGTTFHCLKRAHPADGFDRWYGEDKRLGYAEECGSFTVGAPVEVDVDRELAPFSSDPEVLELMENGW